MKQISNITNTHASTRHATAPVHVTQGPYYDITITCIFSVQLKIKNVGGVKTYARGCGDAGNVDCTVAQAKDVQCSGDVSYA